MVAWVDSASLHKWYSFSPNQLVFGENLNFPSILINKTSVLEGKLNSESFYLNTMHTACKAFIDTEAEARKKLGRTIIA